MKSYDDLQRFKEKTQTTHIEFKDMSEQARNSDNTNWAIIKQLVNDGADTVLDNSQRINVITPQLADPSAFIPPTSPPVPEAEPLPPFKALVPAQQNGSLLDSISSSLKPVTQPEAPISAPSIAPAVSSPAATVQLTKVAELRPESVALAGSSLFEQLAQQSPNQPAPHSAPPSPENTPAPQAFSPPTAQTPHPHQVSAESLHQLLQEQLPPNPDYPSRPVQPLQPAYQSQPQPVTPPQGYQPQPQPVSPPAGYQPQPQPQQVSPPVGYQPQPQPVSPPASYQPQPQQVSPPPGYHPPQPNYQSLLQQMPPQPGYPPQLQQMPLQPGYPQPGYSSQLQQMSPPMGYPQPPLPGYPPQQPGYPSQLQQVPPQQTMPYYQPQPQNGPMMQRNVFPAAISPNISYKQLFSPASELADHANSKEMLLQSLLEKIASCR